MQSAVVKKQQIILSYCF